VPVSSLFEALLSCPVGLDPWRAFPQFSRAISKLQLNARMKLDRRRFRRNCRRSVHGRVLPDAL